MGVFKLMGSHADEIVLGHIESIEFNVGALDFEQILFEGLSAPLQFRRLFPHLIIQGIIFDQDCELIGNKGQQEYFPVRVALSCPGRRPS